MQNNNKTIYFTWNDKQSSGESWNERIKLICTWYTDVALVRSGSLASFASFASRSLIHSVQLVHSFRSLHRLVCFAYYFNTLNIRCSRFSSVHIWYFSLSLNCIWHIHAIRCDALRCATMRCDGDMNAAIEWNLVSGNISAIQHTRETLLELSVSEYKNRK